MESVSVPTRQPPKPRTRNALLKQYYGLKDKANNGTIASSVQSEEDNARPFDLGIQFEIDNRMLSTHSL